MRALSSRNAEPEKASRPFDLNRDGFVMGEGSGILVLEEMNHALERGAKIYAEVAGYGLSGDAYHISAPEPDGGGAIACMSEAIRDAGLKPEDIDYINAHGTSTKLNDESETRAIKAVFGEHVRKLAVSSTKSMTGHLLGGAGGVEAIFTVLAIKEGILPPTINYETPDPECDLDYVPNVARKAAIKAAMSNSFGFGGTNASLVFRAFEAVNRTIRSPWRIAFTTSCPFTTLPNTVCLPSRWGWGEWVMKNWLPFVFGPAFAMEMTPVSCLSGFPFSSSSNWYPGPPRPVPVGSPPWIMKLLMTRWKVTPS